MITKIILALTLAFTVSFQGIALADGGKITPSPLQKHSSSQKWRLVYIEGGPYIDYAMIFNATIDGLYELGLIENKYTGTVSSTQDMEKVWSWLAQNAGGDYIEFVEDGFYSANWDADRRNQNKIDILERIKTKNDIDIILAFGTGAGLDMATDEHNVPTLSMSVTDAVQAGIIQSIEDSGLDHVHGQVELGRYERQLSIFYDIFTFKKLGVPTPNTDEGKASIAYNDILRVAEKLNFEVVPCEAGLFEDDGTSFTNLQQCIETLSESSDAIYMTTNSGMQWDKMGILLEPIIKAGIPSFSQSGLMETKLGVLMSIAQNSFANEGMHGAETVLGVIEGAKPRSLSQVFEGPLGLAMNLEMAIRIGWNPPFEVLAASDIVYQEIFTIEDEAEEK
ncbi:MAG: ABC transporter substrate binding protein [Pseudomonadota bacterium]